MADNEEPKNQEQSQEQTQQATPADSGQDVTDSHGQPGINKERHDREIAERDQKIADLQAKLDEQAKNEKGRAELKAEMEKLRGEWADEKLTYQLELAGCRSPKMAKAVLADYEGDIQKLKAAEPWLFAESKQGSTGGKPGGTSTGSDEIDKELRKAAGLPERKG